MTKTSTNIATEMIKILQLNSGCWKFWPEVRAASDFFRNEVFHDQETPKLLPLAL